MAGEREGKKTKVKTSLYYCMFVLFSPTVQATSVLEKLAFWRQLNIRITVLFTFSAQKCLLRQHAYRKSANVENTGKWAFAEGREGSSPKYQHKTQAISITYQKWNVTSSFRTEYLSPSISGTFPGPSMPAVTTWMTGPRVERLKVN